MERSKEQFQDGLQCFFLRRRRHAKAACGLEFAQPIKWKIQAEEAFQSAKSEIDSLRKESQSLKSKVSELKKPSRIESSQATLQLSGALKKDR